MRSDQTRTYDRASSVVFLKTNEPFGGLSNMAGGYALHVQGVHILTSEALYQACRFPHLPEVQRLIIGQVSPMTAKMKSKPHRKDSRPDWDQVRVKVMRWCLRVKLAQNWSTFSQLLLLTGDRPIVEESRKDDFWGANPINEHTLVGMNVLGRLLMELREAVKSDGHNAFLHVEPLAIPNFMLFGRPIDAIAGGGVEKIAPVETAGSHDTRADAGSYGTEQASLFDPPVAKEGPLPAYVTEHPRLARLKPYPAMRDSGVDWLGDVPAHWAMKRLKLTAHLTDRKVEADEDNPVPYIGMENIESWTSRLSFINPDVVPAGTANVFKAGHTLFGKLRPYLAKACNPDFDGLCSTELLVLKGAELDRRTLLYLLLSDGFIKLVDSSTYGSKMPRASWDFIGNCEVPLAPPEEQRAIADFLDRETAKIDSLVAKKRRLIERLKEKRTALISRTVTRGLPPDAARAAGLHPKPKLKPSGIEWIGEMPQHWSVVPIKSLAKRGGRTFTDGDWIELPHIVDDGVRLIQTGNVGIGQYREQGFRYISEESFHELGCTEVKPNDVLICRLDGPVGRACVAPDLGVRMITSVDNTILKMRSDVSPSFVAYVFSSSPWLSWIDALCRVGGGFRLRISRTMLGNIRMPIPESREQVAIANYLDHETAKIHELIAKVEAAVERLCEYRSALITAAVTGKIDVRGVGDSLRSSTARTESATINA